MQWENAKKEWVKNIFITIYALGISLLFIAKQRFWIGYGLKTRLSDKDKRIERSLFFKQVHDGSNINQLLTKS